jgi:hypothetical protein
MPIWIAWIRDHWLSLMLGAGVIIAALLVWANRQLLFYKE